MSSPVDVPRERTCLRCRQQFTEPTGTVTRICDRCRRRGVGGDIADGTVVDRRRERTCIRCGDAFTERPGEITRLCPTCDSDHLFLE
ncbi:MAG: hypothetical protein ABEJ73_03260 [Haloplanus sp.]